MMGTSQVKERRRKQRSASVPVAVTVHEVSSARPTVVRGQVVDLCETGLGIVTRDRIADRASVTLRVEPWDWSGNGFVRYCAQKGLKFSIGLELTPGTRQPAPRRACES
jgi:hypothetical protein